MVALARMGRDGKPTRMCEIAQRTGLSRGYLEQLAIFLKSATLVSGVCGRNGGYMLARPAHEITLAEIIQAAIGPFSLSDCVRSPDVCVRSEWCECRDLWAVIGSRVAAVFDEYTLADLCDPECQKRISEQAVRDDLRVASRSGVRPAEGRPERSPP